MFHPLPTRTMKLRTAFASQLFTVALSACATGVAPAPTPVPMQATAVAARPVTPPTEAPANWQLLDETADGVPGMSAEKAMRELLRTRTPKRIVVVAVIDGGVDTAHVDLRANLWLNPKETAGNHADDDGNGHIDDVRGWDFIGGADGRDVHWDTYEVTRLYAACKRATDAGSAPPSAASTPVDRAQCGKITEEFDRKRGEAQGTMQQIKQIEQAFSRVVPALRAAIGGDSLTTASVRAFKPVDAQLEQAKRIYLQLADRGITQKVVEDAAKATETQVKYGLDPSFDPRPLVGDNYANPVERNYGNNDVTGPDAKHGTHVAGIIGAVRGNGVGIDGVATSVRIMAIRAVPDGDERDKDVANAIRYAVDNGAQVINMSFGKSWSPFKGAVDEAVRYADAKGVLMVHAAGNDGQDNDSLPNFPTPYYLAGGRAVNWIEVGASSWKLADSLVASFSNFGKKQVDVFAPGVDILSTVPGNGYEREAGTSMAAPMVTGLAALLMSYYPDLTASDVKRIILASAVHKADQVVMKPGSGAKVLFGSLSVSGGIANVYQAVKMAEAGVVRQ